MNRNISDTSLSLNKRDGLPVDEGKIVINKYKKLFDRYKNQTQSQMGNFIEFIDINFEDLIKNPIDCIKSIEEKFQLDIIKDNKDKILDFIDPDLKHF